MASFSSITLSGDNLGQRHRCFNTLVREAKDMGVSFQDIEPLIEKSPVDRLFKIDLANGYKNMDYIIRNLKDSDMLFVSRALKATWLLEHHEIINPKYLEEVLFPEMVTPAVSKMKHWLYINLRDPSVCQEFYLYYKEKTFEYAIKFFGHCSNDFILNEVSKVLTKISPHYLKILCEKCPQVAKIYFDSLALDEELRKLYLDQEETYYNSVKCVLKADADVFLDITEKYYNMNSFRRLSPLATNYILRYHKSRFTHKIELYVAYFLHIPTVADRLSIEECQEVVIKLAQANYLHRWFEYKVVEPLIKRISPDKRAAFKKRVFVEKDIGKCVNDWPYDTPASPPYTNTDPHVFDDQTFMPIQGFSRKNMKKRPIQKRSGRFCSDYVIESSCIAMHMKSELDRLFDEFRFIGFDRALHDLAQRLGTAGSADRRRDMFLVLVSKSGGRSDAVSALLRLAVRHSNEPAHTRAAIIRSLVKRANVWRLPADAWQNLLLFGHGLGLDGTSSEAACLEGLHSVVIRQLLVGECQPTVTAAFLSNFSNLAEYSLSQDEQKRIAVGLQNILVASAVHAEPEVAARYLSELLEVMRIYRVHIEPTSPAVKAVIALASRDEKAARPLLERLYNAKIARRELFRINLKFRRDEAMLLNALRHDPSALELEQVSKTLTKRNTHFDRFISKLVIYFDQNEGFARQLRDALKDKIEQELNVKLARPLASLLGRDLEKMLHELEEAGTDRWRIAAALRACAHRARPSMNLVNWGWRKIGVRAVATHAMRCKEVERAALATALVKERHTVRVALALSMRSESDLVLDTFTSAAKLRPEATLRAALMYFHRYNVKADPRVWDVIKPLILSVDLKSRVSLQKLLKKIDCIPSTIKPDYCATLYMAIEKISVSAAEHLLCDISDILPKMNDESIENILVRILEKTVEDIPALPYPAIFIRYLMLSKSDEDLQRRYKKIGDRFFDRLDTLLSEKDTSFNERLDQIVESLKYNAAFFDTKFTSCLLVIERILTWMQKFMPKEKYFKKYVQIHLTLLYYKAVRQSIKQMPEVFIDAKRKKWEGVEAVGFVLGRYIVKEVAELVDIYFVSIVELYTEALVDYLNIYLMHGISRAKFIGSVIKGILAEGVGMQRRMAVYVLSERRYDIEDSMVKEIEDLMIKDKALELFVHAKVIT